MTKPNPEKIGSYRIVRKIGEGGYGIVYLASKIETGELFALKAILHASAKKRECSALDILRRTSTVDGCIPLLDSGMDGDIFYYVMPLADPLKGGAGISPLDVGYEAKTLASIIASRDEFAPGWFSEREIKNMISPVFSAAIAIGKSGLLHRDIKPDNIIFISGDVYLSDFGLLCEDRRSVSSYGTPYFFAPNWYVNSGGNPDMWGLAASFYMLITGNLPDAMGRVSFKYPVGVDSFSDKEKPQWDHWHRCILRATAEYPADRFIRLEDFRDAVFSSDFNSSIEYDVKKRSSKNKRRNSIFVLASLILTIFAAIGIWMLLFAPNSIDDGQIATDSRALTESLQVISAEEIEDGQNLKQIVPLAAMMGINLSRDDLIDIYKNGRVFKDIKVEARGIEPKVIEYVEVLSYRQWKEKYLKGQKEYLTLKERIKDLSNGKNATNELEELQRRTMAAAHFYEFETPIRFDKYIVYIDMCINPGNYYL